jgi:6-phosphogluconolactonase
MRYVKVIQHATTLPTIHRFSTHAQASAALAARVAEDLEEAIAERGEASIAVPGGTTPGEFLSALGGRTLDWRHITIMLTDERWVPPDHPRSNAGLVTRTLGRKGARYRWYPLWREGVAPDDAAADLDAGSTDMVWPLDVVVMGMGEDGHVASLFPGDETGFAPRARRFVAITGPGDEPRVSLSAQSLVRARKAYLLFRGAAKLATLSNALRGSLPVARVLDARRAKVHVFVGD